MVRPRVIIESPFAGDEDRNLQYLRRCLRDSWERGENPFASHAFYPLFLRESDPDERRAGIEAGYDLWKGAEKIILYIDLGISPGMEKARVRAALYHVETEIRSIGAN